MPEELSRQERLLGAILVALMGEVAQSEKARALRLAGISNTDIASILGTTSNVIRQQLYELGVTKRSKSTRGSRKKRRAK